MNAHATNTARQPWNRDESRDTDASGFYRTWRRLHLPSLRLRVSERKLLLFIVDALLINGSLATALAVRSLQFQNGSAVSLAKWFITLTLVWAGSALFFDIYNLARAASTFVGLRGGMAAALTTAILYTFIPVLTPPLSTRSFLFLFTMLAVGTIGTWRLLYARIFAQPWFKQQALVVGAGWAGQTLARALHAAPEVETNPFRGTGYRLVGYIDDDPDTWNTRVDGVPVLGASQDLVGLAQQMGVDEIIVAITHRHAIDTALFDGLLRCRELGLRLTTMPVIYERLLGRVPVDHIGRDLQVVVPMEELPHERAYQLLKRCIDLAFGLLALVVVGLIVPWVAACNALTSPGPLFYRQKRVGRGGRIFEMVKFRSMVPDAECHTGAIWACAGDDRITPAGRILRKTRLDELPQAINILRGEMSLIGPRPERPEFVEQLAREIPFYRARHAVRPGITGWAQVQFEYGNSMDDAKTKLEYDLYYVKHAGPLLDARIALTTLPVMLALRGL